MLNRAPNLYDIETAADRIGPYIHRTPVYGSRAIERIAGCAIRFKCENFQKTGSFKIRGATNLIRQVADMETNRSVATHSSGNHAQAVACAASACGLEAHVVMPENASAIKVAAVREYGGRVVFCEPTLEARERGLREVAEETGAFFVPPYDHFDIIAGQGTAALELLEESSDLDAVLVPVGGGGLAAGTCLAVHFLNPAIQVYGAEPEGADDAKRSLDAGRIIPQTGPRTIADGLLTSLGERNFPILSRHLADILPVCDRGILSAMKMIWERMKIIVEPSGAVPLAAALANGQLFAGRRVGVILSGGNVDLEKPLFSRDG